MIVQDVRKILTCNIWIFKKEPTALDRIIYATDYWYDCNVGKRSANNTTERVT